MAAELRLLPLLSTHLLLFWEIGERWLSPRDRPRHRTYSAYRKLGVSSRSEAVASRHELGLDAL
jgi:LuxR family transcriptional regulator, maltose regulon positive regulatory protein